MSSDPPVIAGEYILYVGNVEPRKNLVRLLETYKRLSKALTDRCRLVMVGSGVRKGRDRMDSDTTVSQEDLAVLLQDGPNEEDIRQSIPVAQKALAIARRTGVELDLELIRRGALFHDLGKAITRRGSSRSGSSCMPNSKRRSASSTKKGSLCTTSS